MNENVKKQIMEQSRHQFIYGYDGLTREKFLKSLEIDYPIRVNENVPMAIYMNDFSLPNINNIGQNVDILRLSTISREFFNFVIVYNIIDRIIEQDKLNFLDSRIDSFLKRMSKLCFINEGIMSFDELFNLLKESRDFYMKYYQDYLLGKELLPNINELKMPFLEINSVIKLIKNLLNNQSYFGIIIDKQIDIPVISMQSINGFVTRRINSDISMKVSCDPEKWNVYYDLGGMLIEYIHDYGVIELDNSANKYVKKLKDKYSKF